MALSRCRVNFRKMRFNLNFYLFALFFNITCKIAQHLFDCEFYKLSKSSIYPNKSFTKIQTSKQSSKFSAFYHCFQF